MGDIFRPALLLVSYNYRPSSGCSLAPYNHFSASFCRSDLKRLLSEYEADYSSPRNVPSKAFLCFSLRDIACLNSTYRRTPYSSFPPPLLLSLWRPRLSWSCWHHWPLSMLKSLCMESMALFKPQRAVLPVHLLPRRRIPLLRSILWC